MTNIKPTCTYGELIRPAAWQLTSLFAVA